MDIEYLRDYCLSLPHVTEDFPFGPENLVFRVGGKMFCLTDLEDGDRANLKCDPERAIELREQYQGVLPGYHMNKKHWNTVLFNQDYSDVQIKESIDHSYQLVLKSLPKKQRDALSDR